MEAHNGKTRLGNSEVPLVVKFADAKRKDAVANQVHNETSETCVHVTYTGRMNGCLDCAVVFQFLRLVLIL